MEKKIRFDVVISDGVRIRRVVPGRPVFLLKYNIEALKFVHGGYCSKNGFD